ncbi:Amidophosphoribosyltransferase [compost metagenome]
MLNAQGDCALCRQNPGGVEGVFAIGTYAGSLRKLIRLLKYQNRVDLGLYLGAQLADRIRMLADPGWLVVPIPLHEERRRQRGYNQAELLAWQLARRLELDYAPHALRRPTNGRPFYLRGRSERWEAAQGAFRGEPGRIKGRRILLVDDIMTSGATAWGAAGALRQAGASEVWLAVAARAALKAAPLAAKALTGHASGL